MLTISISPDPGVGPLDGGRSTSVDPPAPHRFNPAAWSATSVHPPWAGPGAGKGQQRPFSVIIDGVR